MSVLPSHLQGLRETVPSEERSSAGERRQGLGRRLRPSALQSTNGQQS